MLRGNTVHGTPFAVEALYYFSREASSGRYSFLTAFKYKKEPWVSVDYRVQRSADLKDVGFGAPTPLGLAIDRLCGMLDSEGKILAHSQDIRASLYECPMTLGNVDEAETWMISDLVKTPEGYRCKMAQLPKTKPWCFVMTRMAKAVDRQKILKSIGKFNCAQPQLLATHLEGKHSVGVDSSKGIFKTLWNTSRHQTLSVGLLVRQLIRIYPNPQCVGCRLVARMAARGSAALALKDESASPYSKIAVVSGKQLERAKRSLMLIGGEVDLSLNALGCLLDTPNTRLFSLFVHECHRYKYKWRANAGCLGVIEMCHAIGHILKCDPSRVENRLIEMIGALHPKKQRKMLRIISRKHSEPRFPIKITEPVFANASGDVHCFLSSVGILLSVLDYLPDPVKRRPTKIEEWWGWNWRTFEKSKLILRSAWCALHWKVLVFRRLKLAIHWVKLGREAGLHEKWTGELIRYRG
ncbi:hypothetical protein SAMN05444156_0848 [Verrucomicrobium sp. GAS474]|nr:hypothetical protein SAMN05444156_0848 [Verrucomicrobium sp. GAS474]